MVDLTTTAKLTNFVNSCLKICVIFSFNKYWWKLVRKSFVDHATELKNTFLRHSETNDTGNSGPHVILVLSVAVLFITPLLDHLCRCTETISLSVGYFIRIVWLSGMAVWLVIKEPLQIVFSHSETVMQLVLTYPVEIIITHGRY